MDGLVQGKPKYGPIADCVLLMAVIKKSKMLIISLA